MNEPLDPLPDDLSEALAQLTPPPSPAGAREALLEQLHRLQGVGAAAAGSAATATTAGATATAATTVPWWFAAGALVVGVGAGIGVDRLALRPEPPPPVVAKVTVAEQIVPLPAAPAVVVPDPPVPVPAPQVVRAPPPPPPPVRPRVVEQPSEAPAADESLRAERVLIDGARAVVARDASRALSLLEEHRARFPSGQLAEEREALSIQTLVLLRRVDDARARLVAFEQQHQTSPLRAALRRLVEESGKE